MTGHVERNWHFRKENRVNGDVDICVPDLVLFELALQERCDPHCVEKLK
jgi:hypothetical protein